MTAHISSTVLNLNRILFASLSLLLGSHLWALHILETFSYALTIYYIGNRNNEMKYLCDGQCYVINSTRILSNITQYFFSFVWFVAIAFAFFAFFFRVSYFSQAISSISWQGCCFAVVFIHSHTNPNKFVRQYYKRKEHLWIGTRRALLALLLVEFLKTQGLRRNKKKNTENIWSPGRVSVWYQDQRITTRKW